MLSGMYISINMMAVGVAIFFSIIYINILRNKDKGRKVPAWANKVGILNILKLKYTQFGV